MSRTDAYEWATRHAEDLATAATEKAYAGEGDVAAALAGAAQAHATLALAEATLIAAGKE